MERYFYYLDSELYCHHSLDAFPCRENYSVHVHENYELYYFLQGEASYLVEGTEYELKAHDVLLIRSSETHKTKIYTSAPYERIAIHFAPDLFSRFDTDSTLLAPFTDRPLGKNNRYREEDFLTDRYKECFCDLDARKYDGENRMFILSRTLLILTELLYAYRKRKSSEFPADDAEPSNEMISYINRHLFDDLSLESIGRRFFLSKSQLNRVFRRDTGSSVWEYVRIKRLLAAKARLLAGDNAANVCTECGFKDYSSFYRAYLSCFGSPPSSERKNNIGKK